MEEMQEREKNILLFDTYGVLLTEKQQQYFKDYYFLDLSLSEIASSYSVSRNAIYDQIHLAIGNLQQYEDKLKLIAKKAAILSNIKDEKEKTIIEKIFNE